MSLPSPRVEIVEEDGARTIRSNGIPAHPTGSFPNRGNPNAIRPQRHLFRVPLDPQPSREPTPLTLGPFGVAVNGVPFDPGAAEWWRDDPRTGWQVEALSEHVDLGHDASHAHVQPTGAYHYHGVPTGLVKRLGGDDEMLLVGWAADGFPVYSRTGYHDALDATSPVRLMISSWRLKEGIRPGGDRGPGGAYDGRYVQDWEYVAGTGDLDACNGRWGVTPEHPEGTYYYVLTEVFPFIPRCLRGAPDPSFRRRGPQEDARRPSRGERPAQGPPRDDGPPPRHAPRRR